MVARIPYYEGNTATNKGISLFVRPVCGADAYGRLGSHL